MKKDNSYVFGVDIGGTRIKFGLFYQEKLIDKWDTQTNLENNGKLVISNVMTSVLSKMAEKNICIEDIIGIGIGIPGDIDDNNVIQNAVNLGWNRFSLEKEVRQYLDVPVKGGNDANYAAMGEMWQGAGQKYSDFVMVTLGTGIGAGIIHNKKLLIGANGSGGEVGHMPINPSENEICQCGHRGCLEQYSSATGVVRLARKMLSVGCIDSKLGDVEVEKLTAKDIFVAAKAKDRLALEVIVQCADYLGRALAAIACTLDPQAFILGGGLTAAGDILLEQVKCAYENYAFKDCISTEFMMAQLGNDAGIYGAVKAVMDLK